MNRRLLAMTAICALAALTITGLWALASKPASTWLLGGLDDEREERADNA